MAGDPSNEDNRPGAPEECDERPNCTPRFERGRNDASDVPAYVSQRNGRDRALNGRRRWSRPSPHQDSAPKSDPDGRSRQGVSRCLDVLEDQTVGRPGREQKPGDLIGRHPRPGGTTVRLTPTRTDVQSARLLHAPALTSPPPPAIGSSVANTEPICCPPLPHAYTDA